MSLRAHARQQPTRVVPTGARVAIEAYAARSVTDFGGELRKALTVVLLGTALLALTASHVLAATLSVDDDLTDCPSAAYTSIQAAIDAAAEADVIAVCPGTYVEGPGGAGTNALTITKSLTLRGAGADLVTVTPNPANGNQIADAVLELRDGVGDILAIVGVPEAPIDVAVSGITFSGAGVYVEAGVVFRDARGSVVRSRVTRIVTSEQAAASSTPGGYRSQFPGVGIAQVTSGAGLSGTPVRTLTIDRTRVDKYNTIGVLIDGATGDATPLVETGVSNWGVVRASQIVGRTQCINFDTTGNCTNPGLLTTGTLFGQDGLRITAGSTATVTSSTITQNLVNGSGAPTRNSATNNANLKLGAGVRLIGAAASSITTSNVVDDAYGVINLQLDGSTTSTAPRVSAENVWWGLRPSPTSNPGPAISPTTNPPAPENPVNGATVVEAEGTNSTAVDFLPYRNGSQGDPNTGEHPVLDAPIPVSDAPPAVELTTDKATYARGETVVLTADATDDFGVKSVTFYDGATALGSDGLAPFTTTFEIPADAPCAARAFSAVAKDSAGQTAGDDVAIAVTGCDVTPTPTPTATETPDPTPTATETPDPTPTATETPDPTPTATETPDPTPTATETPDPTPTATETPDPTPTATETPDPTPTPTGPRRTPTATDVTPTRRRHRPRRSVTRTRARLRRWT